MEAEQRNEEQRKDDDVEGEEALDGEVADLRAAAQDGGGECAHEGDGRGNLQADLGGVVAELVHGEEIAAEAEHRGEEEQGDAGEPADFARLAVGLHEVDGEHVDEDGEDEEVGAPGVGGADEPAEVHDVGDLADALEGLGAGAVVDQQQDAGEDLDEEEEERDAAPVVPEGLGVDGDALVAGEGDDFGETEAFVEPW